MSSEILQATKIGTWRSHEGALWRVSLDAPKGNVLDATMCAELTSFFRAAAADSAIKAIVLSAEGRHFSFGASVEEHQRDQVAAMFEAFHGMFRAILDAHVPVLAAVRGSCLGGGLELAAFCHRLIAHPTASLGQPEIALGVFAPVASAILPERIGRGAADDLLLSGRVLEADQARAIGLADDISDAPEATAVAWAEAQLLPHSASSLRYATQAARLGFARRFEEAVKDLETLYLEGLMATQDANEGIAAFLERRPAVWCNA